MLFAALQVPRLIALELGASRDRTEPRQQRRGLHLGDDRRGRFGCGKARFDQ
jgi:hypothetical protein